MDKLKVPQSPPVKEDLSTMPALRSAGENPDELEVTGRTRSLTLQSEIDWETASLSMCPTGNNGKPEGEVLMSVIASIRNDLYSRGKFI